jgi:hypothetical protein
VPQTSGTLRACAGVALLLSLCLFSLNCYLVAAVEEGKINLKFKIIIWTANGSEQTMTEQVSVAVTL